jgi:hypothetical protein
MTVDTVVAKIVSKTTLNVPKNQLTFVQAGYHHIIGTQSQRSHIISYAE